MSKYYRLGMNCSRVYNRGRFSNDYGSIEVLPVKGTVEKTTFFGKRLVPGIEYRGRYYVIAELVDDHFEDIILRKRIDYDSNGIRDVAIASDEELKNETIVGLTCYMFNEIDCSIAEYYSNKIKEDPGMLEKYTYEMESIEYKKYVLKELDKRTSFSTEETEYKRKLRKKSA